MRLIHTADLHLGMKPDRGKPWSGEREKELWDCIERLVGECGRRRADLLLIAGDLFHRPPSMEELRELDFVFSSLTNTTAVLIAGNHDYQGPDSSYSRYAWNSRVVFLGGRRLQSVFFPELSTRVYGLSCDRRNIKEALLDEARPEGSGIHILMGHGGEPDSLPVDFKKLSARGFDYVALGHIHKPGRAAGNIYYAGSPEPLDRTETGGHGFYFAELTDDEAPVKRVTFVPFACRRYETIRAEAAPDMTERELVTRVRSEIENRGSEHLYTLLFTGYRNREIEIRPERFYGLGNLVRIEDETLPDYDFEEWMLQNKNTAIEKLIRRIRKSGQPDSIADKALYYGMEALLYGSDPAGSKRLGG